MMDTAWLVGIVRYVYLPVAGEMGLDNPQSVDPGGCEAVYGFVH